MEDAFRLFLSHPFFLYIRFFIATQSRVVFLFMYLHRYIYIYLYILFFSTFFTSMRWHKLNNDLCFLFRSLNPPFKTFRKRDESERDKNTTKQTINILVFSFFFLGIFSAYQNVRDTCVKICDQFVLNKSCKCDFYTRPKPAGRDTASPLGSTATSRYAFGTNILVLFSRI